MSNRLVSHLCDLILILKQAKADGEILGIVASCEDGEIVVECRVTGEAFDRVDALMGEAYDEFQAWPTARMLRVGSLFFLSHTPEPGFVGSRKGTR